MPRELVLRVVGRGTLRVRSVEQVLLAVVPRRTAERRLARQVEREQALAGLDGREDGRVAAVRRRFEPDVAAGAVIRDRGGQLPPAHGTEGFQARDNTPAQHARFPREDRSGRIAPTGLQTQRCVARAVPERRAPLEGGFRSTRWGRSRGCSIGRVGWPRGIAPSGLPQIRTCGFPASGSSRRGLR